MARSLLFLFPFGIVFGLMDCHGASTSSEKVPSSNQTAPAAGRVFVSQNAYIRRPTTAPLCAISAERERNYWGGFIDRTGRIIVEPLLSGTDQFSEGYALVTVDTEQVAIEQDGKIVARQSPGVRAWQQGKRSLPPKNEKKCFIDTKGRVVSKLFDADNGFDCYMADGVAMVRQHRGIFVMHTEIYGYIDRFGNWVIPPSYPEAHPFFEGLGRVRPSGVNRGRGGIVSAGPFGYVDATGRMAIAAQFALADDFHEGLAAVSKDGIRWGYIDKTGKMVIQPQFKYALGFHEGLAVAATDAIDHCGFIDRSGNWAIPPRYALARDFSEGLASFDIVVNDVSKMGFVNSKGTEVVRPEYDWASPFSYGLAAVGKKVDGAIKCGYIDRGGHVVTPITLDDARPLADGMGRIKADGKYGYVDRTGKMVIALQYEDANDFCGGLASVTVRRDGRALQTCIDASGKIIWQESPAK